MPKIPFDFTKITPEIPDAPQRSESLAPYQMNIQALKTGAAGRSNLAAGVSSLTSSAAGAYKKYTDAQDESDMVAARAAYLRLKKEEDQAIASTSNPMEIQKINEDYNKRYGEIMSGNDPAFDRPYFRNETGRSEFQRQFGNNFNLKRELEAKDKMFNLDRRNTLSGFENGINSVIKSDYYDQPSAEIETAEYIDKMVEHGFLTEQEGIEKKQLALGNLDMERSARKLLDLDPTPTMDFNGSGAKNPLPNQVEQYKDYIDGLTNIDDKQKAQFKKKADSILSQSIAATKAAKKERDEEIKKAQSKYENDVSLQLIKGEIPLSKAINLPGISQTYKKNLIKNLGERVDETRAKMEANNLATLALRYPGSHDPGLRNQAKLINQISLNSALSTEMKKYYYEIITKGHQLTPAQKTNYDAHMDEINRLYGMTKESFEALAKDPWGFKGPRAETDDGVSTVDGLTTYERQLRINNAQNKYLELMGQNKEKEAEEFIGNFIKSSEKNINTYKFNNIFYKRK